MQERRNSIANRLELCLSCTKPSICIWYHKMHYSDNGHDGALKQPGADQRKHQSSVSLAFVRGIHWWPVNSPHKWPVTQKMFPFDDVIMACQLREFCCPSVAPESHLYATILGTQELPKWENLRSCQYAHISWSLCSIYLYPANKQRTRAVRDCLIRPLASIRNALLVDCA